MQRIYVLMSILLAVGIIHSTPSGLRFPVANYDCSFCLLNLVFFLGCILPHKIRLESACSTNFPYSHIEILVNMYGFIRYQAYELHLQV